MLDYDGTLAAFRKDPGEAFPYPGISSLLGQIIAAGKTRVVIISGRNANQIRELLHLDPRPEIWGLHGLQRWKTDGSVELVSLGERTLQSLATAANWLRGERVQETAEYKLGSIAVHWRGLSEAEAANVRDCVLSGWKPIAQQTGLVLLAFDGGIQIRAPETDKGVAVRTIMSEMTPDTPAAYLGDDTTDEHAFEAMRGCGLSVLVRSHWRPTAAQVWLKPPAEVLDLLTRWLDASRSRHKSDDSAAEEVTA
jgi:trehalose-phosphatase